MQIAEFSVESLKKILSKEDLERLLKEAFNLGQAKTVNKLLHAGLCNKLLKIENSDQENC